MSERRSLLGTKRAHPLLRVRWVKTGNQNALYRGEKIANNSILNERLLKVASTFERRPFWISLYAQNIKFRMKATDRLVFKVIKCK